jgi:hypothetical protein
VITDGSQACRRWCCVNIPVGAFATGSWAGWETATLRSAKCVGVGMRDASSDKPASGRPGRCRRPGFDYQVRLVSGEAGQRLEREQAEAIAEVLRWVAADPGPVAAAAVGAVPQAGGGPAGPWRGAAAFGGGGVAVSAAAAGPRGEAGGVGRPVREVARLVGCIRGRWAGGSGRPRVDGRATRAPWTLRTSRTATRIRMADRTRLPRHRSATAVPCRALPCPPSGGCEMIHCAFLVL